MKTRSISSSTVAVSRPSDSVEVCSGQKLGSAGSEPSTRVHSARHLAEASQRVEERLVAGDDRVERALPPVLAARDEPLHDPERRLHLRADVRVPAGELGDVLEPGLGQEAQQLELGVDPGLDAAEHLQDQRVVEDDRRVRLLALDQPRRLRIAHARSRWRRTRPLLRLACTVSPVRISSSNVRACASSASASKPLPSVSSWYVSCVPVSKRTSTS